MKGAARRKGLTLLIAMMVVAVTSAMTMGTLNSIRSRWMLEKAVRERTRAEQLAEAAVQHAFALLDTTPTWRGDLDWQPLPVNSEHLYRFTVETRSTGEIRILGYGFSDGGYATVEVIHAF